MMKQFLNQYIDLWNLTECCKLTSTFTSDVYKANSKYGKVVLKILNDVGVKDELAGTYFLDNCNGNGVVKLFEYNERALLMEYLPGDNLYQFSKIGDENKASEIFCSIIKKIHTVDKINHRDRLIQYTELFEIFDRVSLPVELQDYFSKARELSRKLVSTQNKEVLLHGDLHHENVISRLNGEFVCIDSKGLIGDPSYELATTLKNPWDYPEISQDINLFKSRAKYFSRELNLPIDRIIGFSFVHLCLSVAWAIEDGHNYSHQENIMRKVYGLLFY